MPRLKTWVIGIIFRVVFTTRVIIMRHISRKSSDCSKSSCSGGSNMSSDNSCPILANLRITNGDEDDEDMDKVFSPTLMRSLSVDAVTLDRLDIIKTIGTGTFGRVALALDTETEEYFALKILALHDLIRYKQIEHARNERNILCSVRHPFIISLKCFFKDEYNIYFMMDYACGGELFSYLRKSGKFSTQACSFYGAEIVSALEYLHSKNIVHRDLKPENLLLDKEGHLKITDFGFAKFLKTKTWTICGTPEYLAPEIILKKGYTKAVDWWALGILLYEMHCGVSPFFNANKHSTYERIISGRIEWPPKIFKDGSSAKDIIRKLLVPDKDKRLGSNKYGADGVKAHRFFRDYNWEDVYQKKLTAPIIPKISYDGDTSNFEHYPDTWRMRSITDDQMELFMDF